MKNLFIKVHPRYLAWYSDSSNYGTIILHSNLLKNYEEIKKLFLWLKSKSVGYKVFFENPHIELIGTSQIKVYHDIQHVQRLIGILQVLCWETFKLDPLSLIPVMGNTMQEKIDLFDNIFNTTTYFSALEKMCIIECYLLAKSLQNAE